MNLQRSKTVIQWALGFATCGQMICRYVRISTSSIRIIFCLSVLWTKEYLSVQWPTALWAVTKPLNLSIIVNMHIYYNIHTLETGGGRIVFTAWDWNMWCMIKCKINHGNHAQFSARQDVDESWMQPEIGWPPRDLRCGFLHRGKFVPYFLWQIEWLEFPMAISGWWFGTWLFWLSIQLGIIIPFFSTPWIWFAVHVIYSDYQCL
jgi:hypothetical protein